MLTPLEDEPDGGAEGIVSMRKLETILGRPRHDIIRFAEHTARYYRAFDERRGPFSDKWRHIDAPTPELKGLQRRLLDRYLAHVPLPRTMLGGVPKRSIRDNAAFHVKAPLVVRLDLKDCYKRTTSQQVSRVFRRRLACSPKISRLLTKLTTVRGHLPTGAPTSTAVANLVMLDMHNDIVTIGTSVGVEVTQWIDDIILSGVRCTEVIDEVIGRIQREGYAVSSKKLRVMRAGGRQEVTGVTVNAGISAPRTFRREVGLQMTGLHQKQSAPSSMLDSLRGKVAHIRSLSPGQARRMTCLLEMLSRSDDEGAREAKKERRPCRCRVEAIRPKL